MYSWIRISHSHSRLQYSLIWTSLSNKFLLSMGDNRLRWGLAYRLGCKLLRLYFLPLERPPNFQQCDQISVKVFLKNLNYKSENLTFQESCLCLWWGLTFWPLLTVFLLRTYIKGCVCAEELHYDPSWLCLFWRLTFWPSLGWVCA